MSYRGTIRFERLDREKWEAELAAHGQAVKGPGGADMRMTSRLQPTEAGTRVSVSSEVNISGILAQLGRGMIETVSGQLFRQFGEALRAKLAGATAPATAPESLDALSLGAKAVGQTVRRLLGGKGDAA
jgi:carbon monoxide dehydrogenase subunit G